MCGLPEDSHSKLVSFKYRLISRLSAPSKAIEKIIRRSILDYLENYELLNDKQYGYSVYASTIILQINDLPSTSTGIHSSAVIFDASNEYTSCKMAAKS